MTTKLISMNIGIQLTLLVDGKEQKVSWSAVCPSESFVEPLFILGELCELLNEHFETGYMVRNRKENRVTIAKVHRIKAPKRVSQAEFNKRIKELQP